MNEDIERKAERNGERSGKGRRLLSKVIERIGPE